MSSAAQTFAVPLSGASVLNTKVLVLNRSYLPVHVTSVKRAFALLYQGVARVVDDQYRTFDFDSWRDLAIDVHHERLGVVGGFIRVPRVLLLTAYERIPKRHVRFSRFNIFARDNNTCQYCGTAPAAHRAQSRSRDAAVARRHLDLGEYRLLLSSLQSQKRRTHSGGGRDGSGPSAASARMDSVQRRDVLAQALPRMDAIPVAGG